MSKGDHIRDNDEGHDLHATTTNALDGPASKELGDVVCGAADYRTDCEHENRRKEQFSAPEYVGNGSDEGDKYRMSQQK